MLTRLACMVLVVVAGCGGGPEPRAAKPAATATATPAARVQRVVEPGALLGTVTAWDGNSGALLAAVDRRSLEPGVPWSDLGEYHDAWSVSPDGRLAAFGISAPGRTARVGLRVVDLATLQTIRDHEVGSVAEAIGWLAADRLVAFLQTGELVVVDPETGEEHARQTVGAVSCPFAVPNAVTDAGFVMLLSVAGAARLVVTDAQGHTRTRELPQIAAGELFGFCAAASLAVDQERLVAYVVGAHAPVAEVDLRTMETRQHRLARSPSLLAGCRACGADLTAVWLGDGRFAVAGYELRPTGLRRHRVRPAGALVIDTRRWTAHTIARDTGGAVRAGDDLLVFDGRHPSAAPRQGDGLRVFDTRGRPRYTLLAGERVGDVQIAGRRAYARTARGLRVVDLRRARVLARFPRRPRDVQLVWPR